MDRIQAMIRAGGPAQQFAMALLQKYVVPQTPVVIPEGGSAYNPVTGALIARGQPKPVVQTPGSNIGIVSQGPDGKPIVTTAGGNSSGMPTPQGISFAVDRLIAGDEKAITGLPRGAAGTVVYSEVMNELARRAASGQITPQQLITARASADALISGNKALGTQEAKVGSAAVEAGNAIGLARGAIDNVSRTSSWGPLSQSFNKLQQLYDEHALNPAQTELYVRAQAVMNTYATVMSRNGVPTDSARAHAEALLPTDGSPATWNKALDTLQSEINMAKTSPGTMRQMFKQEFEGNGSSNAPTPSPQGPAAPQARQQLPRGTTGATVVNDAKQAWASATPQQRTAMQTKAMQYGIDLTKYGLK
jgi:hypothetical protein